MRRGLLLIVGLVLLALIALWRTDSVVQAQDTGQDKSPWHVGLVTRQRQAQPGAAASQANGSGKFLHVEVDFVPATAARKLHEFRVTNRQGRTVSEIYGFYKDHNLLVFEGDWSSLRGLYLDGLGHREPLLPITTPSAKPAEAAGKTPQRTPAVAEPSAPDRVVSSPAETTVTAPRQTNVVRAPMDKTAVVRPSPKETVLFGRPERVVAEDRIPQRGLVREGSETPSRDQPTGSSGKLLYQELVVAQKSVCGVQGIDSRSDLRYSVLSSLALHDRNNGGLDVEQKVEAAKLLQADAATQSLFSGLLQKLTGTTFTIGFNSEREITRFEGAKDRVQAAGGPEVGQAILLASLIDRDGWKELARYSFFQPHKPLPAGTRWERSMTHSWGFLGSWMGQVSFRYAGQQDDLQRFPYAFHLAYVPPKADARNELLPVSGASFKHGEAGGTIYFDPGKQRVSRVEERFCVKGQMSIEVLGQNLPVELDEAQTFQVRLLERDPRSRQTTEPARHEFRTGTEGPARKAKTQQEPKAETEAD
ncbi:MAG: hypothetical protein ACLQNE_46435 [Thermoguttaceae bacterium]